MVPVETVTIMRVYDHPAPEDGHRVLVDRLWPRGVAKAEAPVDEWLKDVAPSTELRKWYSHEPERFDDFRRRYQAELDEPAAHAALLRLRDLAGQRRICLVTATKSVDYSHATVLAELLAGGE